MDVCQLTTVARGNTATTATATAAAIQNSLGAAGATCGGTTDSSTK